MIHTRGANRSVPLSSTPSIPLLNALPRSCTLCRKTLRIKPATTQIMRIISLKTPATPADWTSSYACFEKETQTKLNVRRTRYANISVQCSSVRVPSLFPFVLFFSPNFFFAVFASRTFLSDAQPSSMVSFAEAVSHRVQRRKSDVHGPPTRSSRWTNRYKATSPSPMRVTRSTAMAHYFPLRPSNTAKSNRRQDHCPPLPSRQIKDSLKSLRTLRRPPL